MTETSELVAGKDVGGGDMVGGGGERRASAERKDAGEAGGFGAMHPRNLPGADNARKMHNSGTKLSLVRFFCLVWERGFVPKRSVVGP